MLPTMLPAPVAIGRYRESKKEKNIFTERDKRNGRVHTVVSLQRLDGDRFRRRCPNWALALDLLARINGAVVTELKFVDSHAAKVVIEAQRQEQLEWGAQNWQQTGNTERVELSVSVN